MPFGSGEEVEGQAAAGFAGGDCEGRGERAGGGSRRCGEEPADQGHSVERSGFCDAAEGEAFGAADREV